jgi:cation transport ATPase
MALAIVRAMRAYSIFTIPADISVADRQTRRHMLARTGLAWLAMMQVMMFAFPGYLSTDGMAPDNRLLLEQAVFLMNWISLIITVPVILYCASPVWKGALASLSRGSVGMDVPVALGIVAAFVPSVHATWAGHGEVYFDSVTMFVAFLLTARYLELCARQSVGQGGVHQHIEQHRAALSARANTVAFWFVLVQLALAFMAGAVWYVYSPEHAVAVMVALLVISCPCAMAMAVPTAIAAAHASLASDTELPPARVAGLIRLMQRVALQSLAGAVVWHLLVSPLAVLGYVSPWVAAITMLVSSLAVAANAWRLFRQQTRRPGTAWHAPVAQG